MNVPHYRQEQANSCLPACVRMALAYLGTESDESSLRRLLRTRRVGTSPVRVMLELPRIGFQAIVLDGTMQVLAEYLAAGRPCIVHLWTEYLDYWQEAVIHAVVVTEVAEDQVTVNDPVFAEGGKQIQRDRFVDAWRSAGYLLMVVQSAQV
jgi:ABC-type bacteriocin/lantibiotic exporter with double-glycine peptidase domain